MTSSPLRTITIFRTTAFAEGVSTVILFFIAMPLKYFNDMPEAVKYTGWVHGLLFLLYLVFLTICWVKYKWKFTRVVLFFLAALIPFAPFIVERKLKDE